MEYDALIAPDPEEWLEMDEGDREFEIRDYHKQVKIKIPNLSLHATYHVVVENQIAKNYQPTVKAMARLMKEGLDRHEAIHAIALVVTDQIYYTIKNKNRPDPKIHERKLNELTTEKPIEIFSDLDKMKPQKKVPESLSIPQVTLKQVTNVGALRCFEWV